MITLTVTVLEISIGSLTDCECLVRHQLNGRIIILIMPNPKAHNQVLP